MRTKFCQDALHSFTQVPDSSHSFNIVCVSPVKEQILLNNLWTEKKMSSKTAFKIIVIGGGITAVIWANMFEKFELDYLLLEAFKAAA